MRLLVVVFGSHCFLLPSVMNRQPQHTQGSWEKLFQYFIWFPQYWDCDCCAMNTHTHTHTHTQSMRPPRTCFYTGVQDSRWLPLNGSKHKAAVHYVVPLQPTHSQTHFVSLLQLDVCSFCLHASLYLWSAFRLTNLVMSSALKAWS